MKTPLKQYMLAFILKITTGTASVMRVVWLDRWQAWDALGGCLSRSVGPSRFPLSPVFTPWRQHRDYKLNSAVFPLTPPRVRYVWTLTSTCILTLSMRNVDTLFCLFNAVEMYSLLRRRQWFTRPAADQTGGCCGAAVEMLRRTC